MPGHACWNCGAPMPIGAPGSVGRCPFCGSESRDEAPNASPSPPPGNHLSSGSGSGGTTTSWGCVGAVVLLAAGIGGVVWGVHSCGRGAGPSSSPKLKLADLATTPFAFGWNAVDAPPIVGSYRSFDAVANIEWAKKIGTAWKADAILYRLQADGVAKDGTVDLVITPNASAEYRFVSPRCVGDYKRSTALVDPKTNCGFFVDVKAEHGTPGVEVLPVSAREVDTELEDPVCTMTQAFAALEKAGKLPPKPVYKADVYSFSRTPAAYKAKWTISTVISGQGSIPVVDATTCAIGW